MNTMDDEHDTNHMFCLIKDVIAKINKIREKQNENKTIVLLFGPEGAGKSSLINALSQNRKLMIVKGKGNRTIVDGEGVNNGYRHDMNVEIIFDDSDLIFCEIPDFTETATFQEFVSGFALDSLLSANKFKILLVFTEGYFSCHLQSLRHYINVLADIFHNRDQLKSGIGLVVTHSDPDMRGEDYAYIIHDEYKEFDELSFFFKDEQNVFTLPRPSKRDIGKEYVFDDHDKIISFLKENPIVSSRHIILLSQESELGLKKLIANLEVKYSNAVKNVIEKINHQIMNEDKKEEIYKWKNRMEKIKSCYVKTANDFVNVIKENIPNYDLYNDDMKIVTDFEVFNQYIDRVYYRTISEKPDFIEQFRNGVKQSIDLLNVIIKWMHTS